MKRRKRDAKEKKKKEQPAVQEEKKSAAGADVAVVELCLEDQEDAASGDGSEEAPEQLYASWAVKDVESFAEELTRMVAAHDKKKKERFPLSALVAVLDNVPENILKAHALLDVLCTLKQMARLPRKEKLVPIFDLMKNMVGKARSMHPPARTESPSPAEDPEGETVEAVVADAQMAQANSEPRE